jgi:hypothetical protein
MGKQRTKKAGEYKLTHDAFFEETFGMPSLGSAFLKRVLPRKLRKQLDFDQLTVVKTKFRDVLFRETRPDIVYNVPIIGSDEYVSFHVIVEHKSFDDHSAIYQVWQYVAQLCVQDVEKRLIDPKMKKRRKWSKNFRLSPIIPIILHHGEKPFTGETQLVNLFYPLPGAEEYLPHLQAILVDLSAIEEGNLPRDPNAPELHVVLLIMKVIFSKDKKTLKHGFFAILDELNPYSQNPRYYELIRKLWHYTLYNARKLTETDYEEFEPAVQKTIGDDNMPTLVEIFMKKGMKQGIEKGIEKGIGKGKIESILAILEDGFGEIPQSIQNALAEISDPVALRRLTILAAKCKSLKEFTKALK